MKSNVVHALLPILALLGSPAAAQQMVSAETGRQIAEANCARCHAIGAEGDSRHPVAPAFRTLSERYPIDALQEAFAEGIYVGHAAVQTRRHRLDS